MSLTQRPLDNPINWSFKIGRLFDIDIRVHIVFVLAAIILISMEIPRGEGAVRPPLGTLLLSALGTYAILFVIVLLHEFGHCWGARHMGGDADEILLWPLGGLASTNPPHTPEGHMVTTVAGPMVNVIICCVCSVAIALWMGSLWAIPWNPLTPTWPVDASIIPSPSQSWLLRVFGISYILLLFNLLPIFPFDGGRIVQAALWRKHSYGRSMQIATSTGMIGAIALGVFALFAGDRNFLIMGIAVFGYLTCMQQRRMAAEMDAFGGNEFGYDFSRGYASLEEGETQRTPGPIARWKTKRAAAKAERAREEELSRQRQVEDILKKISETGLASLSPKERKLLEEETARKRGG